MWSWWSSWQAFLRISCCGKTRKRKQSLEARLRQSQKLEAIGTLASGLAHEINTPLTVALGQMELVRLGFKEMSPELADTIHGKLIRIRELVVEGLIKNIGLMTKETSDGLTPVRKERTEREEAWNEV